MDSEKNQSIDEFWELEDIAGILDGKKKPSSAPPAPAPAKPQNRPPERPRPNPGPVQARPAPPKPQQAAKRPEPANTANAANMANIKEANMFDGAPSGHTRKFDAAKSAPGGAKTGNPANQVHDGTYHYTGRDIKSSRQMFEKFEKRDSGERELEVSENREKIKNRRKEENAEIQKSGSIIYGILKVVLYIVGVAVVSGIISYNLVMVANDVFAFVKEPVEAEVVIPEGADIPEIARILHEKEIIKYPGIFSFYLNYRKKDRVWEYEPGVYTVSSDTGYDDLLAIFRRKAAAREIVRITIPEGYSIEEIISEFVDNNKIGSREGFEKVINEYDFSEMYRFLKPLYETTLSPDRKYRLEGYIFPDTYDFYRDESELSIIIKFLDNFNSKFTEDCYSKVKVLDEAYMKVTGRGMTIDDIVSLASIVQWEAALNLDFPKISAVFHNRIASPATYPRLESDATVQYAHLERLYDEDKGRYRFKRPVGDALRVLLDSDEPYNTYKQSGLPPSAICNPGYEAIWSALWPEENSPYYFFVANTTTGEVYYGETLAKHNENIIKARAGG